MTAEEEFKSIQASCEQKIVDFAQRQSECMQNLGGATESEAAAAKIEASGFSLAQASLYIAISDLRIQESGQPNAPALEDARKCVAAALSLLAEIVSDKIDMPFSESAEKSRVLDGIPLSDRLRLMRKIGALLDILSREYEDNFRLKWSVVDLWARFAAVAKNFVDVGKVVKASFDFQDPSREDCRAYISAMTLAMRRAIDWHSKRFDFSSRSVDDLGKASLYADMCARILSASGAGRDASEMKKLAGYFDEKLSANLRMRKGANKTSG